MFAAGMLLVLAAADPLIAEPATIDAGVAHAGQPFVRRFDLVNSSDQPITIAELRANCGCAAPAIDRRTLPPGERATVTIDVNTLSQPAGAVRWSVTAEWQSGARSGQLTWQLTAHLIREIELQPAALVLAGTPALSHDIAISDRRPKPLTITSVRSSSGRVTTEILPDRRVHVRIAGDCPPGTHTEQLLIATDDPKYPELRVPVTVHRRDDSRFMAVPARAVVTPGASVLIQIRTATNESVMLGELTARHPALTTRWAPGPGSVATIRVGLDKSRWDGQPFTSEVTATMSGAGGEKVRIPVNVRVDQ